MTTTAHHSKRVYAGASRSRGMLPQEESPTLSLHRELFPYMYKERKPKPARGSFSTHVAAWMTANGPATAEDIAAATGVSTFVLKEYLRSGKIPGAFDTGTLVRGQWGPRRLWGITQE